MLRNERGRLENLREYGILDTPGEREFDDLVQMAALLCETPMAVISFVDRDRIWLKAKVGLTLEEHSRTESFCHHAIDSGDTFIVRDAASDLRFARHQAVMNEPKVRFYAAIPLVTKEGYAIGALCVSDFVSRDLSPRQHKFLVTLANQVVALLERNRYAMEYEALRVSLRENAKLTTLGRMAATLVHEINNPLTVLHARATMLTPENASETKGKLLESTRRMIKIIGGLIAGLGNSEHEVIQSASLKNIIEETLSFCRPRFISHNVEFEYTIPGEDLIIECRPVQISQIILNLLNNALDAALENPGKRIWTRLEIEESESEVKIAVVDSGKSIPSEIAGKIFNPFFTTKSPGKGTGLGLSIAHDIAVAHRGDLKLDTRARYTTFVFSLPKKQP